MSFLTILVLSTLVFLTSSYAQQNTRYADEIKIIEDYVTKEIARLNLPSISIAFYKDDFTWSEGFGYADLEHRTPPTPETLYRLASISKPITAVGILELMEEGKLSLDDEVQKYVPYFPRKRWPVTIRRLLGHLSGISHYRNYDEEGHFKTHFTTEQAIGVFKDWDLEAEPGARYIYSTYGFNLLGAVIEGASGKPYAEYMRERVWEPLGMKSTRMDIADEIIPNRARGYRGLGGELRNCEFVDISSRFAGGGILSTAEDLVSFSRGLDEGKVLSPETQRMMYDSMVLKDGHLSPYGMGWGVEFIQGFWGVSHGGGQAGTSTFLLRFPAERFAVAVTCNDESHGAANYAYLVSSLVLGAAPYRLETPSEVGFRKLRVTFLNGLGYYGKYGESLAADEQDLAESFRYFNGLDPAAKETRQRIGDGEELFTGAPLVKVGTAMAERIGKKYGPEKLAQLRRGGSIPFFKTYIDLYRLDDSIPREQRFTAELEREVDAWHESWARTWDDKTRRYFFIPLDDLGNRIEEIKERFAGEIVYPRLNTLFNTYAYYLRGKDRPDEGLAALLTAAELFPTDANLFDSIGEFYLSKGDKAKALEFYKKALEINPEFASSLAALERLEEKHPLDYLIRHKRVEAEK